MDKREVVQARETTHLIHRCELASDKEAKEQGDCEKKPKPPLTLSLYSEEGPIGRFWLLGHSYWD